MRTHDGKIGTAGSLLGRSRFDRSVSALPVMRPFSRDAGPPVPEQHSATRAVLRGAGRSMAEPLRREMELRFGADFSDVRVHTDAVAHASAQDLDASAYTAGSHIVFRRGAYDATSAAGRATLVHELSHVIQQRQGAVSGHRVGDGLAVSDPGDAFERAAEVTARRAIARTLPATPAVGRQSTPPVLLPGTGTGPVVVQRWWELRKRKQEDAKEGKEPILPRTGVPPVLPRTGVPPVSDKQDRSLRWDDNRKEPKRAYRFRDLTGQGWQADDSKEPFAKADWSDETPGSAKGAPPERRSAGYRQRTADRRKGRPAPERALNRVARVLARALPERGSPHLAVAMIGDYLEVAGNTGPRHVTMSQRVDADAWLVAARDPKSTREPGKGGRRARQDNHKLRALASGDYVAQHTKHAAALTAVAGVLARPVTWHNVGAGGELSEHGEMTLLRALLVHMSKNPNNTPDPITVYLGGVLYACQMCRNAIDAFNTYIAGPLGYQITAPGTHKQLYPNWVMPDFIMANEKAKAAVAKVPAGWYFKDGVLTESSIIDTSKAKSNDKQQLEPYPSDSEWEEDHT